LYRDGGLTKLTAKHDFTWNDASITTVMSVCQVMSNSYEFAISFEHGVEGFNLNFLATYQELLQALRGAGLVGARRFHDDREGRQS
jgi:hypothetical protein